MRPSGAKARIIFSFWRHGWEPCPFKTVSSETIYAETIYETSPSKCEAKKASPASGLEPVSPNPLKVTQKRPCTHGLAALALALKPVSFRAVSLATGNFRPSARRQTNAPQKK